MFESAWIEISPRERLVLLDALAVLGESRSINAAEVDALAVKLVHTQPHPKITIGVQSGQVQWTAGNPFPVWICDYDGEEGDLPDVDAHGQRCRIWAEPPHAGHDPSPVGDEVR
jgi:hypothetical protein